MESKRFDMTRRNFVKLSGAASILSATALAGCGNSGSSASTASGSGSASAFKIGNIGPLTGAAAIYGSAPRTAPSSPSTRSTPLVAFSSSTTARMTSTIRRSPSMPTTT